MTKNKSKQDFGKCMCPDGKKLIVNFFQTEFIHGRQWTLVLLEDGSVVFKIESAIEGNFENVIQQFRLSKKTIALLQLCLVQANLDFDLQMESTLEQMLGENKKDVNLKKAKK